MNVSVLFSAKLVGILKTSIVSGKGRVTIPKELRDRYGLKKGDRIHVIDYGRVLSIVPASKSPVKSAKGMLKGKTPLVKALVKSRQEGSTRGK